MTNGDFKSLKQIQDIESHNVWKMAKDLGIPKGMRWNMIRRTSRDNARTPVQWTGEEGAGFTDGKPWLRINSNHTQINMQKDKADPNGVFAFYKKMIALRKELDVLKEGSFVSLAETGKVYAFERRLGDKRTVSLMNMTGKPVKIPAISLPKQLLICNYNDPKEDYLQPFEFRLLTDF